MSDTEIEQVEQVEEIVQESTEVTIEDALKAVLKTALIHDGLVRGLRESSKALSKGEGQLAVLCDSVTESSIVTLVEALCNETEEKVPLIKVSDAKLLGEWAGLGKIDREGNARKVVGASVVVITNWGADSAERNILLEHFANQ